LTGEIKSGQTGLAIAQGTPIDVFKQDLLVDGPPGLIKKGGRQRKLAVVEGTRTVLAVRIVVDNAAPTFSEAVLSDEVFGNGVDPVNLVERYDQCSFGALQFTKAASVGRISNGVLTVTLSGYVASQGDAVLRNAATAAINAEFGVSSPTALANHVMYCMPTGAMTGVAYATVNGWNSVYNDFWCNRVSAQVHELGE
jgi:hypothetical protein